MMCGFNGGSSNVADFKSLALRWISDITPAVSASGSGRNRFFNAATSCPSGSDAPLNRICRLDLFDAILPEAVQELAMTNMFGLFASANVRFHN